jgi:SAM-dependent methyltransferase
MSTTNTHAPPGEWPPGGLESVERCPACGESARELLHAGLTDRTYMIAPGVWSLFRCRRCSCAYLDPRPNERTIHLAYSDHYEGAAPPDTSDQQSGWRRLRRKVRNGYLNSRYGYHPAQASRLGSLLVPVLPAYRQKADELVRHLSARPGRPGVLDVGCGEGDFLAEMQALGWAVEGIEPSAGGAAVARARGVAVIERSFTDVSLPAASLDAITFRLVFEALPEPVAALEACRDALKPGGVLWIYSPNLESEAHRVFGPAWILLDPPRNVVLHSRSSLVRLLSRVGFEVDAVRPSRQTGWSFRLSTAIARGLPPFKRPPPLSRRGDLRAHVTEAKALLRPELADVMVVVAHKS